MNFHYYKISDYNYTKINKLRKLKHYIPNISSTLMNTVLNFYTYTFLTNEIVGYVYIVNDMLLSVKILFYFSM